MNRTALDITVATGCFAIMAACSSTSSSDTKEQLPSEEGTSIPAAGDSENKRIETATGLPCDVDAVLKSRCQTCHDTDPKYGASAPLVTWDDLQRDAPHNPSDGKVYELVKARVRDDSRPMPPSPHPRLDDKELSALDAWISDGAKSSTARCTNEAPTDGVKALSCTPDTVLKAKTPFTMQPGSPLDQYVCFGVDITVSKKRHVTALAPKIDNAKLVHHILLFQTNSAESPEPFQCEAFGSAAWKLVAGWAPGGDNLELPKEAGFPQEAGTTHWVLQIHYNNASAQTGTDQSGYELCTTEDLRPNDASVLAFGSVNFSIPPRADHKIRCDYRLGSEFQNVHLFNATPHMHTFGQSMSTERIPNGNGTPEMVFEQNSFSFEAQDNNPISKDVAPGDVLRTRCGWRNKSDATVRFGEGTGDEMCFNFIGYYPAIPDRTIPLLNLPVFTWVTPSLNASCSVE